MDRAQILAAAEALGYDLRRVSEVRLRATPDRAFIEVDTCAWDEDNDQPVLAYCWDTRTDHHEIEDTA